MIRKKIAVKLIVVVGIVMLVTGGPYLYWAMRKVEQDHIHEVIRGSIRLSDSIKNSFRYAMLRDDKTAVEKSVQSVGQLEEIEGLRIYNKFGVVSFSSNTDEKNKKVDMTSASCKPCHQYDEPPKNLSEYDRINIYTNPANNNRTLLLINPIYNGPDCSSAECHVHPKDQRVLGVMDLSISLRKHDIDAKRKRNQFILFIAGLLGVVSMAISAAVHRIVAKPISKLLEGTKTIAAGNLNYMLEESSDDEIGTLAKSFNLMTKSLKDTRYQLLQSERLASLGRMAAGIAHEINNPLTGIMMFASMMRDELPENDPNIESLDIILKETMRCREIIKGLLDFARQKQPDRKPCKLDAVIKNTVKILSSQLQAANVNVNIKLKGEIPSLKMDEVQIQQVFLNLIINAIDAMPDGGTINITLEKANENEIITSIADTGTGIPEEDIPHIFEPFFTKKGVKGTGLGLAVTWGIIQQHGGNIHVTSQKRKGTVFTIILPLDSSKTKRRKKQ